MKRANWPEKLAAQRVSKASRKTGFPMDIASFAAILLNGLIETFQPANLLILVIGLFAGIIGGMLPGISTVTSVALFVPFTFPMPTITAFIGLGAVFCGAMYGGANSAILINTPGQPAAMATAFDGYPLTRKGRAEEALYLALLASAFGGIFGVLVLLFFFEPLSNAALEFGSEAFFWMGIFGLTTLSSMFPGQVLKGLLGGAIGLALSTVGLDPSTGTARFTFGFYSLVQGLDMVAIMIGLFSISQMLSILEDKEEFIAPYNKTPGAFRKALSVIFHNPGKLCGSSLLGTFIGALPGAGGNVASIVAYNEAKRWDKDPSRYGTGVPEGVIVPESSNNASVGGALVPLLSLGIPGSATAAVLAGGLLAQGITPGPQLMEMHPDLAYTFIISLLIANLAMIPVGMFLARVCKRILNVPKLYIIPAVISLSIFGAFALRSSMFDVFIMICAGIGAYLLLKGRIMPAAIALGLVLGPIIEESLVTTIMRARGAVTLTDLLVFSPLSMVFIAACLLALLLPRFLARKKAAPARGPIAFSLKCLYSYDFWVIAVLTAISAIYLWQSLLLPATPGIFPIFVSGSMLCLSCLLLIFSFFAQKPTEQAAEPAGYRKHVVIYCLMLAGIYFVIPLLGFYAACLAGIACMASYGVFCIGSEKATLKALCKVCAFSFGCILLEYACFGLLLHLQLPRGLLM